MKKILFATTALVASAGIASAQDLGVALTGNAEMGIFGGSNFDDPITGFDEGSAQFFTDLDVTFTMSGVADNGLTFGANIDLDEGGDGARFESPEDQGGEVIFVSFGGATLTMGDTDGAYDARIAEMALAGGSLNDDETEHAGFDSQGGFPESLDGAGGDGQIARFDYTFNTFTFSVSMEQETAALGTVAGNDAVFGVGVSYDAELAGLALGVGLGYQKQENVGNALGLSLTSEFSNGVSAGLTFSRFDFDAAGAENQTHAGIGLGYSMGNIAVGINYGKFQNRAGIKDFDQDGVGLAATYDLGGGLSARFGYGKSNFDFGGAKADNDRYSAGLRMNF
ncbi:porin [Puniceibacterium confluentis]|uniref:porin n=1 Tax=Puniceibacterium confluentis TaxID=1958944 RepID=UPI0011B5CC15|nr:porin [Puniceibacterium confluentis]